MPECWTENRLNQLEMVQVVDYHMHYQVVAVSENRLHLVVVTPQLVC